MSLRNQLLMMPRIFSQTPENFPRTLGNYIRNPENFTRNPGTFPRTRGDFKIVLGFLVPVNHEVNHENEFSPGDDEKRNS